MNVISSLSRDNIPKPRILAGYCSICRHQRPLSKGISNMKPVTAKKRVAVIPTNGPLKAVHTTAPDGIVLSGNVPDSVIMKAQQKLADHELNVDNNNAYILQVEACSGTGAASGDSNITVPTTGSRPSSARRFRSMVMSARSRAGDS